MLKQRMGPLREPKVHGVLAMIDDAVSSLEGGIYVAALGVHRIYHSELLSDNTTVTAEIYCAQLQILADEIY